MSLRSTDPTVPARADGPPHPDRLRLATALSLLACAAAVVGGAVSLLRPGLLHGAPVTDGNLRGTALVLLGAGVPLVLVGCWNTVRHGSTRGHLAWLAGSAFLGYQGVMFCFGTPMNRLFPAYVAVLGLAGWALVTLLVALDLPHLGRRLGHVRVVAGVLGTTAVLNLLAWLARALPVAWTGRPPAAVTDSGLDTSPVLVQDLALWLPLALVAALLAWRGDARATVAVHALLLFYAVESLSVAVDQWFGVRADGSAPAVASAGAVPVGLALAAVLAGLWWWCSSSVDADRAGQGSR